MPIRRPVKGVAKRRVAALITMLILRYLELKSKFLLIAFQSRRIAADKYLYLSGLWAWLDELFGEELPQQQLLAYLVISGEHAEY